jgi:hypothetical protein
MDNNNSKKDIKDSLVCGSHNAVSHSNCFVLGSNGHSTSEDEVTFAFGPSDQIHIRSNGDVYYNEQKWRTDSEFRDKLFYYLETMRLNVKAKNLNALNYPNES